MRRNTERERFERWAGMEGYRTDRFASHQVRYPNGMYVTIILNDLWDAWRAAKRDAKRRKP